MQIDRLFDGILKVNKFVLEVYNNVDINSLVFSIACVCFYHLFLDKVFVAVDGKFFLHIWLRLFRDH